MTSYQDIVPYTSVYIDADWKHFLQAAQWSIFSFHDRNRLIQSICDCWTSDSNPNHVLPCLSVRTGFDLFLRVLNLPPGTEVIMSAVNIPDMSRIVHEHKLRIVSIDIDLETMAPKIHLLDSIVTEKSRILVVASIYGRRFDMRPVISAARSHGLLVIEDCAESFGGFEYFGCVESDLSLFSFGPIKHYTAFGGAIAKVRDSEIFKKMYELHDQDPIQPRFEYLKKVLKYAIVYIFLDCPRIVKNGMFLTRYFNIDHKKYAISMLRGFPDKLMVRLRHRPCDALLAMMALRFGKVNPVDVSLSNMKYEYVIERLPTTVSQVGSKADVKNYWLFPIIVDQPDELVKSLNSLGVDAYRGATQLNVIEPDNGDYVHPLSHLSNLDKFVSKFPHEAKYLIDHVVYLPVNKSVPFAELDRICLALSTAMASCTGDSSVSSTRGRLQPKLQSKL